MSDLLEGRLDAERRAQCLINDEALGIQRRTPNRMEELRVAYIKLVCVMLTMMSIAFCAGFSLAKLTTPTQVIHVERTFPNHDVEV